MIETKIEKKWRNSSDSRLKIKSVIWATHVQLYIKTHENPRIFISYFLFGIFFLHEYISLIEQKHRK